LEKNDNGIRLIVGLGNPGTDYDKTRHNAGAWFVQNLADSAHLSLRHEKKFSALYGATQIAGADCHLLIPTTYMNLSGQAVQAIASYFKIPPQAILIAHDELDLPTGLIRLKFNGGHGGHNGLRDIIQRVNTREFYRLRIGIDHPGQAKDVAGYVLQAPSKAESQKITLALTDAERILTYLMSGEFQKAMHLLHTDKA
jgi:PTH1 family peptidyl-tRNA hydrolase